VPIARIAYWRPLGEASPRTQSVGMLKSVHELVYTIAVVDTDPACQARPFQKRRLPPGIECATKARSEMSSIWMRTEARPDGMMPPTAGSVNEPEETVRLAVLMNVPWSGRTTVAVGVERSTMKVIVEVTGSLKPSRSSAREITW
jgi:hypothetical protein